MKKIKQMIELIWNWLRDYSPIYGFGYSKSNKILEETIFKTIVNDKTKEQLDLELFVQVKDNKINVYIMGIYEK